MAYGEKEFVAVPDVPGEWAGVWTFESPPRDIDYPVDPDSDPFDLED